MSVRAVVLLSGGIDSSACLALFLRRGWDVEALFIDFEHPASGAEYASAKKICTHFNVPLFKMKVTGIPRIDSGYIPGRNAMFLNLALSRMAFSQGVIGIGVHAGTSYVDCSPSFVAAFQELVDVYAGGKIKIDAPFLAWDKKQIVEYCASIQLPIEFTYSCERGGDLPCTICATCRDLIALRVAHDGSR